LADVARVESGLQSYAFGIRENGVPATGRYSAFSWRKCYQHGIRYPRAINTTIRRSSRGNEFTVPFDTAPFVKLSILKVVETFVEAMVLVFLRYAAFSAQDSLYADSCDSGAVALLAPLRYVIKRLFHQYSDHVWHGAGHRDYRR
jgi:hypothetical protein